MKQFITWLSTSNRGSNHASLWLRKHVEKLAIKQLLGINLAGLAFAMAVVVPSGNSALSAWEVSRETTPVTIVGGPTERETHWPLASFGLSQYFGWGHPGLDMTAPEGTAVYPIADGKVILVGTLAYGYGNHVIIQHNNDLQSLYAHFSKVTVTAEQNVTKSTKIGEVGSTGWATGNHVHLEVYQNGVSINPLEILPEVK